MTQDAPSRNAVLILRVWIDGEAAAGFRARITQSLDTNAGEHTVATLANAEDIYPVVRAWVETFAGLHRGGDAAVTSR